MPLFPPPEHLFSINDRAAVELVGAFLDQNADSLDLGLVMRLLIPHSWLP